MRHYTKHSYFPLTLTLLTLGLILFMFYAFTFEAEPSSYPIAVEEEEPVDANDYRSELAYAIATFDEGYTDASDDLARLVAAEQAVSDLLDMRVPSEYKELHLELAVTLNQLQTALRSTERSTGDSLNTLEQLKVQYPWLTD